MFTSRVRIAASFCAAVSSSAACAGDVQSSPCEFTPVTQPPLDSLLVIPADARPVCDVILEDQVRLTSRGDEPLARWEVAVTPDHQYVTSTYDRGYLALWSATGEFRQTLGRGPGQGPGEFSTVIAVLVDSMGIAWSFDSYGGAHRYDVGAGSYVGSVSLSGPSGYTGRAALPDGRIIINEGASAGRPLLMIGPDRMRPFGPPTPLGARVRISVVGSDVWSASDYYYEVNHHDLETGAITFRLRREVDWFQVPTIAMLETRYSGTPYSTLHDFSVDQNGLVWTLAAHIVPSEESVQPWIEVLTTDGRLLASTPYEGREEIESIGSNLWRSVDDDLVSTIVISRFVLVERQVGG